jgi:hypothetical protein
MWSWTWRIFGGIAGAGGASGVGVAAGKGACGVGAAAKFDCVFICIVPWVWFQDSGWGGEYKQAFLATLGGRRDRKRFRQISQRWILSRWLKGHMDRTVPFFRYLNRKWRFGVRLRGDGAT